MPAILCHLTADDAFSDAFRDRLAEAAGVRPADIVEIRSLAERALAPGHPDLAPFAAAKAALWIGCRRPRAVRALLAFAQCAVDAASVRWLADTAEQPPSAAGTAPLRPWYPVIDGSRCVNCDQCRQFCLFGVYAKRAEGRIEVTQPLNCKPGCPACARICPARAIIFPFCPESPINGDEPAAPGAAEGHGAPPAAAPSFDALAARRGAAVSRDMIEAALARRTRAKD